MIKKNPYELTKFDKIHYRQITIQEAIEQNVSGGVQWMR